MSTRRWVTVKEIYEVGPGADPIHPGTYGLIHEVDDNGIYVCFPQCHNYFPLDKLQPVTTMPDAQQAMKDIRHFVGHHCTTDAQFQFDIRARHWDFPLLIQRYMEDERKYEIANDLASHELRCMVGEDTDEGIMQLFDFVGTWHQAGRSGGWLVLTCDLSCDPDNLERDLINPEADSPVFFDEEQAAIEQKKAEDRVIDMAMSLRYIESLIKRGVAGYEAWVSSDEPWEEEIKRIKEQREDENLESGDGEDGSDEQCTIAG